VAVDNSEQAQWAVDEAVRLAEALEAKVSLLHVVDVNAGRGAGIGVRRCDESTRIGPRIAGDASESGWPHSG